LAAGISPERNNVLPLALEPLGEVWVVEPVDEISSPRHCGKSAVLALDIRGRSFDHLVELLRGTGVDEGNANDTGVTLKGDEGAFINISERFRKVVEKFMLEHHPHIFGPIEIDV
jgi:hypothetical protein